MNGFLLLLRDIALALGSQFAHMWIGIIGVGLCAFAVVLVMNQPADPMDRGGLGLSALHSSLVLAVPLALVGFALCIWAWGA